MSEAFQYIDILILAIIAGIVLLRLRSVLGRRTGHEKTDKTSYNYESPQTSQEEKVIPIEPKTSSSKTTMAPMIRKSSKVDSEHPVCETKSKRVT